MIAIGRRLRAKIKNDIANLAPRHRDIFGAIMRWQLKVHAADYTLFRDGVKALLNIDVHSIFTKQLPVKRFFEVAAVIGAKCRDDEKAARDTKLGNVHDLSLCVWDSICSKDIIL